MYYWFRFKIQDYMDECPRVIYEMYESELDAKIHADDMMESYQDGTTIYDGIATKEEILKYIHSNEKYYNAIPKNVLDDINDDSKYLAF